MKISDCKEFGKKCMEHRKSLGYTQAYLSEVSGLSTSFISDVENGKATVELGKAMQLAKLIGMDIFLEERV